MTNESIILAERIKLMQDGVLKPMGKKFKFVDSDGKESVVEEPEEIHTYAAWKSMGYQVQKGQKAVTSFGIWKHVVSKKKDEDDDEAQEKMFMQKASFFTRDQVAPITT